MKVSGFTFVRNAEKFDYPIVESITSILPVVDELIVCLGNSEDNTEGLIQSIQSHKIRIVHSVWDDSLRKGGEVLAVETNKAFDSISADTDWAFYLQADEVVHEKYHPVILEGLRKYLHNDEVEGLLFDYKHFYGSYDYVGNSRRWYNHEIRIIRNNHEIRSYRDAQGFRINGRKLNVAPINASIFHYGWVKSPYHQQEKQKSFHKLWHDDKKVDEMVSDSALFDYSTIDSLEKFKETHPMVMQNRISNQSWEFQYDIKQKKLSFKNKVLYWIEKVTGKRLFVYKNYQIIKN